MDVFTRSGASVFPTKTLEQALGRRAHLAMRYRKGMANRHAALLILRTLSSLASDRVCKWRAELSSLFRKAEIVSELSVLPRSAGENVHAKDCCGMPIILSLRIVFADPN